MEEGGFPRSHNLFESRQMACADAPIAGFFASLGKREGEIVMHLGPLHVVGMLATIGLIVGIGVYSRPEGGLRCGFFQRRRGSRGLDCLRGHYGYLGQRPGHHRHGTAGVFLWNVRLVVYSGLGDWLSDSGHWLRRALPAQRLHHPASSGFPGVRSPGGRRREASSAPWAFSSAWWPRCCRPRRC